MLVINLKNASIDETLKLPVVGSKSRGRKGMEDLLTLNITEKGEIRSTAKSNRCRRTSRNAARA